MIDLERYSTGQQQSEWIAKYGSTLRYTYNFRQPPLLISDLKSTDYVYRHSNEFDLFETSKQQMRSMTAENVITSSGEDHKRLRRLMLPFLNSAKASRYRHEIFVITATAFAEMLASFIGGKEDQGWRLTLLIGVIG